MPHSMSGVVAVVRDGAACLLSLLAIIAAIAARRTANEAKRAALAAQEKAKEAVREQIHFGLRRVAQETVREMARTARPTLPDSHLSAEDSSSVGEENDTR